MQVAAILLTLGALGGATLAAIRIGLGKNPPTWLALAHGAVVATGVGFLINAALVATLPQMAMIALGIFVLAALGGATLFAGFHLQGRLLPIALMLGHGATALVGVALLWMSILA
jgi:hypothetical protein